MTDSVEDMSIWNSRFQKNGWSTVQAYSRASRNGYCIEALVLSINMLKSMMFVVLENEYHKRGVPVEKIKRRLSPKKDVGDLIHLMRDVELLNSNEVNTIENYWQLRNNVVHTFIDGAVEYDSICYLVQQFKHVYGIVQDKLFVVRVSEVE